MALQIENTDEQKNIKKDIVEKPIEKPIEESVGIPTDEKAVETEMISKEEFKKLVDKQIELEGIMKGIGFNMVDKQTLVREQELVPKEIPPNDVLKVAHTFFMFSAGGGIYGHSVNSVPKLPPYGRPILFKLANRFKRPRPKFGGHELISISRALIYTKSERDYMKSHPYYGVTIFDDMNDAKNLDTKLLEFTQRTASEFSNMSVDKMIARAKIEGIPIVEDIDSVKKALIQKVTNDKYKEHQSKRVKETEKFSGKFSQNSEAFAGENEVITNPL